MSVIIRLQNLPWSANALDVRTFFKGLSIPDGGVHIVGGEMGDAFIAFSTDEDARQAMMMSGGKIKEVQVSLLLSSRAEMQKVIEEARRTTLSFMALSSQTVAGAAPTPVTVAPVIPKVATVVPTTVAAQPQPPVISLSGFLAQNLNQQQKVAAYSEIPGLGFLTAGGAGGMFQPNAPAAGLFSALNSQSAYGGAGAAAGANSAFTQLSEQLKKAAEAEKAAAAKSVAAAVTGGIVPVATSAAKKDTTSRYSRSSSRERDRRRSSRDRSRSRSRERSRRRSGRDRSRSRSRDRRRSSRDRSRSRSRDRGRRRSGRDRSRSRSRDRDTKDKSKQRVSRFSDRTDSNPLGSPPVAVDARSGKVNPWDTPIQQNLLKLAGSAAAKSVSVPPSVRSPNASIGGFNAGELSQPGYQTKPVAQQVNYGSFEASKPISHETLNKLQELQSRRDTRMFQNPLQTQGNNNGGFGNQEQSGYGYGNDNITSRLMNNNKPNNYNSTGDAGPPNQQHYRQQQSSMYNDEIEGQSIKVSNLETATGYGEIRRFFSGQAISSNGIKMINDPNGKRTGVAYIRFLRKDAKRYAMSRNGQIMRRTPVKVESITDREFDDAIDSYQPGFDERRPYWVESYGGRNEKRDTGVIEIPDESMNDRDNGKCGFLTVWNLPTGTTELDLMRIFSDFTIVEVLIIKNYKNPKQQDGYVKFCRLQDARRACESTHQHFIRSKRVFVKPCSDIEYDAAKNEYETPEDVEETGQSELTKEDPLDDSVHVVEDSADSKKDEDDRMDLAEEDEDEGPDEVVQNKIPLDNPHDGDPPLHDPTPIKPDDDQNWEIEDQQQSAKVSQQVQPPVNFINRDPRNAFSTNLYQSQPPFQQQQQQLPQQSPQPTGPPPQNAVNNFGGDFSRDPRRRQEFNLPRLEGGGAGHQQGENSRENFDNGSRNSFNNGPPPARFNTQQQQQQNRFPDQQQQQQMQISDASERTAFVLITNLEYSMREEMVHAFLEREGFTPKKLQIIRNAFNRSSGECLVEFESVQEARESLAKNATIIGNRKGFFRQLVRGQLPEMMMKINAGQRGPPEGYGGRFGGGNSRNGNGNNNFGGNNNFRNNFRGGNDRFNNNNNSNDGGNFQSSYQNEPNNPSFFNDDQPDRPDDGGGDDQQNYDDQPDLQIVTDENVPKQDDTKNDDQEDDDAIIIHDDDHEEQNQLEQAKSAGSIPSQNGEGGDGPNNSPQNQQQPASHDQLVRGNILSIANLPFRARNEEIADFFKQYNITIDDVKRRYLPDGRPTGDAMVRFQSAEDAQRARETHQQQRIGGRALRMWINQD